MAFDMRKLAVSHTLLGFSCLFGRRIITFHGPKTMMMRERQAKQRSRTVKTMDACERKFFEAISMNQRSSTFVPWFLDRISPSVLNLHRIFSFLINRDSGNRSLKLSHVLFAWQEFTQFSILSNVEGIFLQNIHMIPYETQWSYGFCFCCFILFSGSDVEFCTFTRNCIGNSEVSITVYWRLIYSDISFIGSIPNSWSTSDRHKVAICVLNILSIQFVRSGLVEYSKQLANFQKHRFCAWCSSLEHCSSTIWTASCLKCNLNEKCSWKPWSTYNPSRLSQQRIVRLIRHSIC